MAIWYIGAAWSDEGLRGQMILETGQNARVCSKVIEWESKVDAAGNTSKNQTGARLAYVVSAFPVPTETFILYEILATRLSFS